MADAQEFSAGADEAGGEAAPVLDCSRPEVTMKYRASSDVTNFALAAVVKACVAGADIADLCRMGDKLIEDKVAGIYNRKVEGEKVKKGVAFPTSISVNEICANFSPFKEESQTLKMGDVCKVDMGSHIDGFITVGGHTIVVAAEDGTVSDTNAADGDEQKKIITGRKADVLMAAWTAAEAALRTVQVGKTNSDVTDVMNTAIEQFHCVPVRGVLSHQMKQHVIDGNQVIISKETGEEKVDEFEFQPNEAYGIDIFASTGEGKPKDHPDIRTTIFKRDPEQSYKLKTQLGRKFVHEVTSRFPLLPFTACAFEDARMARAGVTECLRHSLVVPYPVVTEKPGEFVAQFKFTVLLLPTGTKKVTGLPFSQQSSVLSSHSVEDESLKQLLALRPSGKPKKSKSAKAADGPVSGDAPPATA